MLRQKPIPISLTVELIDIFGSLYILGSLVDAFGLELNPVVKPNSHKNNLKGTTDTRVDWGIFVFPRDLTNYTSRTLRAQARMAPTQT